MLINPDIELHDKISLTVAVLRLSGTRAVRIPALLPPEAAVGDLSG